MSDTVINVENISKMYRLGTVGTGTLATDLNRYIAKVRGKEDPTTVVGTNDRSVKADSEFVWSLKDINFDIKQGDAVGIIGKNGAGKSTLLKILSRVTAPTTGSIKIKGRVASLLEVGTGFHPEMSGRDNIFMNGAILGMSRAEIRSKFDEIVDFSGVEKYIDTPVKRYSSGMYVRLAFAVAAHLEPDILIVDEVLAVGDAEFQKKCLGKMQAVNKSEGRTVLFVSHNMIAITALCNSGIILTNGLVSFKGGIEQAAENYLAIKNISMDRSVSFESIRTEKNKDKKAKIVSIKLQEQPIKYLDSISIEITVESAIVISDLVIGVGINTLSYSRLVTVENLENLVSRLEPHKHVTTTVVIPNSSLAPGSYTLSVGIRQLTDNSALDYIPDIIQFEVETTPDTFNISNFPQLGLRPVSKWSYKI